MFPPIACAGCRKCCLGDTITLVEGDDPSSFKTRPSTSVFPGSIGRELRKGKDGNCIYLGKSGCQIYAGRPRMCREFDCRTYALRVTAMSPDDRGSRLLRPSVKEGLSRLAQINAHAGA